MKSGDKSGRRDVLNVRDFQLGVRLWYGGEEFGKHQQQNLKATRREDSR